jgi:hypothetical protein
MTGRMVQFHSAHLSGQHGSKICPLAMYVFEGPSIVGGEFASNGETLFE